MLCPRIVERVIIASGFSDGAFHVLPTCLTDPWVSFGKMCKYTRLTMRKITSAGSIVQNGCRNIVLRSLRQPNCPMSPPWKTRRHQSWSFLNPPYQTEWRYQRPVFYTWAYGADWPEVSWHRLACLPSDLQKDWQDQQDTPFRQETIRTCERNPSNPTKSV